MSASYGWESRKRLDAPVEVPTSQWFLSCDKSAINAGRDTYVQPEANRGGDTGYRIALASETHVIRPAYGGRCEFGGGPND